MSKLRNTLLLISAMFFSSLFTADASGKYNNIKVSVYARACEIHRMGELQWPESRREEILRQVKIAVAIDPKFL